MMAFYSIFGKDHVDQITSSHTTVDYEKVTHSSLLDRMQNHQQVQEAAKGLLRKSVSGGLEKVDHALHAMEEKVLEWKDRLDHADDDIGNDGDSETRKEDEENDPKDKSGTEQKPGELVEKVDTDSGFVDRQQPSSQQTLADVGDMNPSFDIGRNRAYQDSLEKVDWAAISDTDLSKRMREAAADPSVVNKGVIGHHEFYWQYPNTGSKKNMNKSAPTAILVLFQACRREATDWFSSLSGERAPEEAAIVDIARQKGMMVMAFTPKKNQQQQNECFDRLDASGVASILQHVENRQSIIFSPFSTKTPVPMYAFGSERGAIFISSALPRALEKLKKDGDGRIPLDGMVMQNVGARFNKNIPTVFITTPSEEKLDEELDQALEEYDGQAEHIELSAVEMSPSLFSDRIPSIGLEVSSKLFERLGEEKLLNEISLARDPSNDTVLHKVLQKFAKDFRLNMNQVDAILEALQVSWGRLAITRDGVSDALDWLLQQKAPEPDR